MTKWFRAQSVSSTDPVRLAALTDAGAVRPLTPEELVAKTDALTGVAWGRIRKVAGPERERPKSMLTRGWRGHYEMYGGFDAWSASPRHRQFTLPMAQIAKRHATRIATLAVLREFFFVPTSDRRLFAGIELDATPATNGNPAVKKKIAELHDLFHGGHSAADVEQSYTILNAVWSDPYGTNGTGGGWIPLALGDGYEPRDEYGQPIWQWRWFNGDEDHRYFDGILDDADLWTEDHAVIGNEKLRWNKDVRDAFMEDVHASYEELRMGEAWSALVAAMMMDYRYLHL